VTKVPNNAGTDTFLWNEEVRKLLENSGEVDSNNYSIKYDITTDSWHVKSNN